MNEDYNEGYERGYDEGTNDGTRDGYKDGFSDGYDAAEAGVTDNLNREHAEHIDRLVDTFGNKIDVLNAQIYELRKEIFELRIAHAATTRSVQERTS